MHEQSHLNIATARFDENKSAKTDRKITGSEDCVRKGNRLVAFTMEFTEFVSLKV
ncbi:hypothetical protein [Methylobacter tundripaludum]|uniref:hypothetical protein n=1 Tax=Methylobacter tundripaludum TaxID=173365 RepID=UPI000A712603|nr:hypothetical protein [Methylobacter tundripaludum]